MINLLDLTLDFVQIKSTTHDTNSCPTSVNISWTLVPTNTSSHCLLQLPPKLLLLDTDIDSTFGQKFRVQSAGGAV